MSETVSPVARVADASTPAPPSVEPVGLGRRAARGSVVTLGGQLTQMVLQMTSVIALARLLSPHDYGLYAMVLVIAGVGEILRDFGLSSAAVQARTISREQRDNLFWVNTAIGAGLAVVLCASAPLIALLFGAPELVGMARLLSVIFLINGMTTQFRADLNRRMRFGTIALADLTAQVAAVTVAICCAALGARYWALVGSQIAQVSTVLLITSRAARWRPRRPRRSGDIRPFVRFGRNFVGAQFVNYVSNNVDSMTIGLRFGPTPLGLYNRAFQLVMNPMNQLRVPATTVALPVLSRLQDEPIRANEYVRRGQIILGYTIVAGLGIVAGCAKPLVTVLLGNRWEQATTVLALLAIAGASQMLAYVGYWVYLSRGLTRELFRYTFVSLALRVMCIIAGSQWGLIGVAAGYALASACEWPISLWWLSRRTVLPVRDLYQGAGVIVGLAATAGTASYFASRVTASLPDLSQVAVAVAAGGAVYAVASGVLPRVRRDVVTLVGFVRKVLPA